MVYLLWFPKSQKQGSKGSIKRKISKKCKNIEAAGSRQVLKKEASILRPPVSITWSVFVAF